MTIEYSGIRSVTARAFTTALQRDGFTLARQKASHRHYRHLDGRRVTVSFHHASDTFPLATLRSKVEIQAQWSADDLRRLHLISR